jgi:hypothetical protein
MRRNGVLVGGLHGSATACIKGNAYLTAKKHFWRWAFPAAVLMLLC